MLRSQIPEIMDGPEIPEALACAVHRDLKLINRLMGNTRAIIERLRRAVPPVRSVIDIGCGDGALLIEIQNALDLEVCGVDLRPPEIPPPGIPILALDATKDELPQADAAVSVLTIHHQTDIQVIDLIRNVGRSAKRFVILDLVRHPLPLWLYTIFYGPLIHRVTLLDGRQSVRRAYTPPELKTLVETAVEGTEATVDQWVSPIYARQLVEINWPSSLLAEGRKPKKLKADG